MTTKGYIYLAAPYSAPTFQERVDNFLAAQDATIFFARQRLAVYSPIVSWHHIGVYAQLPSEFEFWQTQNEALLTGASAIYVLNHGNWRKSRGVRSELIFARKLDLPCSLVFRHSDEHFEVIPQPFASWTPDQVLTS